MTQEQKDFEEGMQAFNLRICGTANAGRSPNFYRGWTWAWGRNDALCGNQCFFPRDPDYNDGYNNKLTDLHHEHPTPEGDRTTGSLTIGAT
jgi:hypothetical protein